MCSKTSFAVLLAAPLLMGVTDAALAVGATNEPFCETSKSGVSVCQYRTMEQCQQAIKGRDVTCVANPNPPTRPNPAAQPPGATTAQQRSPQTDQDRSAGAKQGMMEGGMMRGMMGGGMMGGSAIRGAPLPMRIIFALVDTDGDGTVSLQEFLAAHEKIFKAMDANKDGVLTMEEMVAFMHGTSRSAPARTRSENSNDESDDED
jgi:hypothetical protein